ncbi:hypothetical protein HDK77DRAFT_440593 [Phyllosticta capitalensis]|uniref:uncharacterized protein n=1 Tax=Phyllosticta capitalensis TaxID=121624 RepID=UPI003131F2EB
MASSLRLLRPFALSACFVSAPLLLLRPWQAQQQSLLWRPERCDSPPSIPGFGDDNAAAAPARTPVWKDGRVNPKVWKQVSSGSILGLLSGVAVGIFSKPLALLIGLLVFGVQFIESRGIHIVPYQRIQRYAKSVDVRSALHDNVAFKLSFGAAFALAGFAEF